MFRKKTSSAADFSHIACVLRSPTLTLAIGVVVRTAKARRSRSHSSNLAPAAFMCGLEVVGRTGVEPARHLVCLKSFCFLHQEKTRACTALFKANHSALHELQPLCTNRWFSMTNSQHSSTGKLQQAEQSAASGYISFMIRPSPESASITANEQNIQNIQNRVSTLVTLRLSPSKRTAKRRYSTKNIARC